MEITVWHITVLTPEGIESDGFFLDQDEAYDRSEHIEEELEEDGFYEEHEYRVSVWNGQLTIPAA